MNAWENLGLEIQDLISMGGEGAAYRAKLLEITRRLDARHRQKTRAIGTRREEAGGLIESLWREAEQEEGIDPGRVQLILAGLAPLLDVDLPEMTADVAVHEDEDASRPRTVGRDSPESRGPERIPDTTAARLAFLRQHWAEIVEQMYLVRRTREIQRDILLESVARAAQKPDFAVSRDWARSMPDIMPQEHAWDAHWYVGDDSRQRSMQSSPGTSSSGGSSAPPEEPESPGAPLPHETFLPDAPAPPSAMPDTPGSPPDVEDDAPEAFRELSQE